MREVYPGVYMMKRTWGSNVYVLPGGNPAMIDAGFPVDRRRIARRLAGFPSDNRWMLVATHYHLDHTGSMKWISESFDTTIAAHAGDAPVMEGSRPYDTFKLKLPQAVYYKTLSPLFRYQYVSVDRKLEEGDVLDTLGGLEVIHVPGHTRGSIALFQRDRGILFSGDTVRNENGVVEGPPPQFSIAPEESFTHIREKLINLDFEVLLPGHGDPIIGAAGDDVRRMMSRRGGTE